MRDDKLVEITPIELAVVWGTAFGQLIDLWTAGWSALLEAGKAESGIGGDAGDTVTVRLVDGGVPVLTVQNMRGESFEEELDGGAVTLTPREPADGQVVVDCTVQESLVVPIIGDIYRGEVVDARGSHVGDIALDAGS